MSNADRQALTRILGKCSNTVAANSRDMFDWKEDLHEIRNIAVVALQQPAPAAPAEGPTPRADAATYRIYGPEESGYRTEYVVVNAAFARDLERELAHANSMEGRTCQHPDGCDNLARVCDGHAERPSTTLREVWLAANKTSNILFSSEAAAQAYVSSFPGSVGGGIRITKLAVFDGATPRSAIAPAQEKS